MFGAFGVWFCVLPFRSRYCTLGLGPLQRRKRTTVVDVVTIRTRLKKKLNLSAHFS